jgi:hypothetical protein
MSRHHSFPVAGATIGGLAGLALYGVCRGVSSLFSSKHKKPEPVPYTPHKITQERRTIDVVMTPVYDHPMDDPNHPYHPENQVVAQQRRAAAHAAYMRRTAFMRTPEHQAEMNEVIDEFDRLVAKRLSKGQQ